MSCLSTALAELYLPALAGLDTAWQQVEPLPAVRSDHCSAVLPDGSVLVTGNYPEVPTVNMAETSKLIIGPDGSLAWQSLPVSIASCTLSRQTEHETAGYVAWAG